MNRAHDGGLIEPHYFGLYNRGHRPKEARLARQATLTKESPAALLSPKHVRAVD